MACYGSTFELDKIFHERRLSARKVDITDWKFSRMMKQSGLHFTEEQLLKILEGLSANAQWEQAISVVQWVYDDKRHWHWKSR